MNIKKINNIKENIKTIPNYIDNKYNYDCLRKYNVCRFLLSNKSANLGKNVNKYNNNSNINLIQTKLDNISIINNKYEDNKQHENVNFEKDYKKITLF